MCWWSLYGNFVPGAFRSYPEPGQVMATYRQLRRKTRLDLAEHLALSEHTIYCLESGSRALSSISRLRQLQSFLCIPPVLLGLADAPGSGAWWSTYGTFAAGDDGFPSPGSVVRFYRKQVCWKQHELAEALSLSEMAIRSMEKNSLSLDAISRRRALHFLLEIPPVLLGLDGMHLTSAPVPVASLFTPPASLISLADVHSVRAALWNGYYSGHAREQVQETQAVLRQVHEALPSLSATERPIWIEQQSLLYQGLANITREYAEDKQVFAYSNQGVKLARLAENTNLLAVALVRRAETLADRGLFEDAALSEREALSLSVTDQVVASGIAMSCPRIFAVAASDRAERTEVFRLLDQARPFGMDDYSFNLEQIILTIRRGQALVNLARNAPDASLLYRQASMLFERIDLSQVSSPRRVLLVKLSQAQVSLGLREYDQAAFQAVEAYAVMQQLKSLLYLPQFIEIYQALQKSPFADSPQVARLGLLLFQTGVL